MRVSPATVKLAVAVAVVLAACDSVDSPDVPNNLNFDAAVVAADGALEDLQMMHGPRLGLPGIVFPPLPNETDCSGFEGRFHCGPIEREGLTYTRMITYLDADGNPIVDADGNPLYDEATTDGIRYQISIEGDIAREWWSASIDRQRDLTVTGLLDDDPDHVTWNGTGSGDVERSRHTDGGEVRSYHMLSSSTISEVVVPYPRTEDGWPVSGTIERAVTITRTSDTNGTETFERTVTVTFDGTQFATVTVGEETFTIDLSERRFGPGKMRDHRGRRRGP